MAAGRHREAALWITAPQPGRSVYYKDSVCSLLCCDLANVGLNKRLCVSLVETKFPESAEARAAGGNRAVNILSRLAFIGKGHPRVPGSPTHQAPS